MNSDRSIHRASNAAKFARPFEGVRVIDVSHVLAGPYCSYQLALLGADVIKVEPPTKGDIARTIGPNAELNARGLGLGFLGQNSNKRSIAIDLKTAAGKEILWRLIDTADVFSENFRPGVMHRLGFDADTVLGRRPGIIYASLTGYGQEGPLSARPAYDHVLQGIAGMMFVNRTLAGEPHRIGFPVVDYVAGLVGAFAIASALYQRTHTGRGQRIDRVRDLTEILDHPNLAQREVLLEAPKMAGLDETLRVPGVGFKLTKGGQTVDRPPPQRGQHSIEVLKSLGYLAQEIDELIAIGAVGVGAPGIAGATAKDATDPSG